MAGLNSAVVATGITATGPQPAAGIDFGADVDGICMEINVTVAGTTGTYQLEGSLDGTNWFACDTWDSQDLSTAASALTRVLTATGVKLYFSDMGVHTQLPKFYRFYRVNATVLTGQTYSAKLYALDVE